MVSLLIGPVLTHDTQGGVFVDADLTQYSRFMEEIQIEIDSRRKTKATMLEADAG